MEGWTKKKIIQNKNPKGRNASQTGIPEKYYSLHPSWNFSSCDKEKWSICSVEVQNLFWSEIFPYLQSLERMTWAEILVLAKKQNHSLASDSLSKAAINRLAEIYVEADSLISLRMSSTHRIYGFISQSVFNILWIDLKHGDNSVCVCRSRKKNT